MENEHRKKGRRKKEVIEQETLSPGQEDEQRNQTNEVNIYIAREYRLTFRSVNPYHEFKNLQLDKLLKGKVGGSDYKE